MFSPKKSIMYSEFLEYLGGWGWGVEGIASFLKFIYFN